MAGGGGNSGGSGSAGSGSGVVGGPHHPRRISLNPKVHEHIPLEYLPNLKKYKYCGSDSSIIGRYIMQPYWNFIVNLVPMTVAPNAITLTGFLIGISSSILVMFYYFFYDAVYPAWVWYYAAAALFIYQTFDAIDGKQARRTKTGGPLGELFDHGCDAFLTPLVQVNLCCALNLPSWMTFVYCTMSSMILFGAIWEQFSTGTLDLGYINGPTEGICAACVMFIITGLYSNSIWDTTVLAPYEVTLSLFFREVTFVISSVRSLIFLYIMAAGCATVAANVVHVICRPSVHVEGTPFLVLLPVLFLLFFHVCLFLTYTSIHDRYPFAFELSFGFLTSYTVTRMTVARLCAMPYSLFNAFYLTTFCVTFGALVVHANFRELEVKYLEPSLGSAMVALAALGVWQYLHMILSVFTQISYYLGIPLLSITPRAELDAL
ncbi:putative choline/ethanolamine phosphotransferase (CEPT) [Trypanosoma conorhini]|uniref:Putative choline/ethanolamine phosphotransferase (CEPT) n=1 Tax=Trypanosoma conorhini TaxID=83891 RepID=A0A3R7LD51_9TRYP|nr:putative choline/ethanolamine phosphotransferase (CEPT) [Trypanosoma conorhini]RNF25985.1 putative choline/ethanolamine phosphotransferase (CEPT) [Trypanosoma conorhini]